jgi:hypothetical protein
MAGMKPAMTTSEIRRNPTVVMAGLDPAIHVFLVSQ